MYSLNAVIGAALMSASTFFVLGMLVGAWWESKRIRAVDEAQRRILLEDTYGERAEDIPVFLRRQCD